MSRRNSLLKMNKNQSKPADSSPKLNEKLNDLDDLDDGFDAEHNINNPFSSSHPSTSSSKWSLNESWRKLQQIMENKDKQTNQNTKKDINSQELSNFSTDDLINDISDCSIYEGEEIQEGDISYVNYSNSSEESIKNIALPFNAGGGSNTTLSNDQTSEINNEIQSTLTINNLNSINTINIINSTTGTSTTPTNSNSSITSLNSTITANITTSTSTTNKEKENKRDETKTHTFLFSKMKKNCSIEQLNELDDKENEKELFDKRKDDLITINGSKTNNETTALSSYNSSSNSNLSTSLMTASSSTKVHQSIRTTTPTKQTTVNRSTPSKSSTIFRTSTLKSRDRYNQMNRFKDLSEESSFDRLSSTDSSDRTNLFNSNNIKQKQKNQSTVQTNVDEPIPSLPFFISNAVNFFRERLSIFSVTTSFCTFFLLIFAIQLSPLSSFANGFLIGIIFSFLFLVIIIIYALNYCFQRIDYENDLHKRILTGERWQKFPAFKKLNSNDGDKLRKQSNSQQTTGVHEGWFFELVYSKKLGVDRMTAAEKFDYEKMPDTKLQLTYIKLEDTIMRVYIPKADQSKKINVDKVSFLKVSNKMNQHIYDFSKMNTKRIQLWLPKNIINKKKYLWSRKFPFILLIEETNKMSEKQRTPFNLILFCRTNRDKEIWYNKFRQSIEIAEQNLQIHHLSTTASTPDEVTHEQENMPRTKSLDIGNISHEFEHLSSFLSYETFIQDLLTQNLYSNSNNSTQTNQQQQQQQQNNQQSTTNSGNQQNNNIELQQQNNLFWFNALVGRVFFDFLTHPHWTKWVQLKIQRKLSRIKLPYFIQTIILKDVNLGSSLPKFLSVANNPQIDEKGIWIDFDLDYQGCFSMTLETKLDLMKLKEAKAPERELKPIKSPTLNQSTIAFEYDDYLSDPESIVSLSDEDSEENLSIEGDKQAKFVKILDKLVVNKYFQQATDTKFFKKKMEEVSNLPILLTVNVHKLKGVLTLNLPPAPTDRIWYGFRSLSSFELESKPSFGERSIHLTPITQILSKKLKQEFHKILVLPNLDDIILNPMKGYEDINILDGEVP